MSMWSVMVVASEAAEKSMIAVSLSLVYEFDSRFDSAD